MYAPTEGLREMLMGSCSDLRDFFHSIPPHGMVFLTLARGASGEIEVSTVRSGTFPEWQLRRAIKMIDQSEIPA